MRKDRNLGILLSIILFLAGTYLLHELTAHPQWYMNIYLIVGSTISAIGLITRSWAIKGHLSIRRLEQYVKGHQQT